MSTGYESGMFLGQPVGYWVQLQDMVEKVGPDAVKIIGALTIQLNDAKREIHSLRQDWADVKRMIEANSGDRRELR